MNISRKWTKLAIASMLILTVATIAVFAAPATYSKGGMVDEFWWHIIVSDDEAMTAAGTHDIDGLGVPRPADLQWFIDHDWTLVNTQRIGYTFGMTNNRVWPFGSPTGSPADADYMPAQYFRKGVFRNINKDEIYGVVAPLNSLCDYYLPPVQAYWRNTSYPAPSFNPEEGADMFDAGGFVEGTVSNPYYDAEYPASTPNLRIDPKTGDPVAFEYYAIGPDEAPIGYETAVMITGWLRKAGLTVNLVAGTWLGVVGRLVNLDLFDYQMMTGVGITWGSLAPDIIYDFTYSENLPLWNFVSMNRTDLDYYGNLMMSTLDLQECREACWEIQRICWETEPYLPYLLWEMFTTFTGPYGDEPGYQGVVNMAGFGALASGNVWGKRLGRADRYDPVRPTVEIGKCRLGAYLDTLNPLTADTVPDWQIMSNCLEGHYDLNPYNHDYMWLGVKAAPDIQKWVGPAGSSSITGGDGVYNAPVTYGADGIITHYDGIPVDDVVATDLAGDDVLGMKSTWELRENLYWQDSDPGPDCVYGTGDDGTVYPVTSEDVAFCYDLMINQSNIRYVSTHRFVVDVVQHTTYKYTILEERRYLFAFEGHGIGLLAPKHIWGPWIAGTDGKLGTSDDNHHHDWYGWEDQYMLDPVRQRFGLSDMWLTYLIGYGPFTYHYGGWTPGQYGHFEANPLYHMAIEGSDPLIGDTNLNGVVEIGDMYIIIDTFGKTPNVDPDYDARGDIAPLAQVVDLDDVYAAAPQIGKVWYP